MYTNLGYIIYRTVLEYYSGDPDEDAYGNFRKGIPFKLTIKYLFFYFRRYEKSNAKRHT